jgi:predicted GTPase
VLAKAQQYENVSWEALGTTQHYTALALDLAREVAQVYHPQIDDPFDPLTLPEVLTCLELAASDLQEWVQKYVPASHLIRIGDIRRARKVWDWYQRGQNAYWLLAALFDPISTAARYTVARGVLAPLFEKTRKNLVIWFHTLFTHRLGYYLIELQSGRLKVGSRRYRELRAQHDRSGTQFGAGPGAEFGPAVPEGKLTPPADALFTPSPPEAAAEAANPVPATLTVVITGPQGAGKSRLITAWTEALEQNKQADHKAADAPPSSGHKAADAQHRAIALHAGEVLHLVEAPGFGADPTAADFQAAVDCIAQADLVLLVTSALVPGRQWETKWLQKYREFFASRPHLRRPPLLVVVTHIDLLPPVSEWPPPAEGSSTTGKEAAIRECLQFVAQQLGIDEAAVIPVGLRPDQVWGIWEQLWPAVLRHLDAAHAAALLRQVYTEVEAERWSRVGRQVRRLIDAAWHKLREQWSKPS